MQQNVSKTSGVRIRPTRISELVTRRRNISVREPVQPNGLIQNEQDKLKVYFLNEVRQIITRNTPLESIVGNDNIKAEIKISMMSMCAETAIIHESLIWKAMLLTGAPGVAKTAMLHACTVEAAKALSRQISFYPVALGNILSRYVGGSEQLINALFLAAEFTKPSVICLDEIDALMGKRNSDQSEVAGRIKSALLSAMAGFNKTHGILVIGTTNRGFSMDTAFLRRFRRIFYVALPNVTERAKIFEKYLSLCSMQQPVDIKKINFEDLSEKTMRFSGDEIRRAVSHAANMCLAVDDNETLCPMKEWLLQGKDIPTGKICSLPITHENILEAIDTVRPALTKTDELHLLSFANKWCVKNPNSSAKKTNTKTRRSFLKLTSMLCCPCTSGSRY